MYVFDILVVAAVFAYLYTQERDAILKHLFLFVSLILADLAFAFSYVLTSTSYDATTGLTTYAYAFSAVSPAITTALALPIVGIFVYVLYKIVRGML